MACVLVLRRPLVVIVYIALLILCFLSTAACLTSSVSCSSSPCPCSTACSSTWAWPPSTASR